MLAACGVDYEEAVPGVDGAKWLTEKAHLEHLRTSGQLVFNQIPLLCIDGLKLVQSRAIVRYLAKKHQLAGSNLEQEAMCDIVNEGIQDWLGACGRGYEFAIGSHEPTQEQIDKFKAGNQKYLPLLERLAIASETGYLMGSHGVAGLSYCDVTLVEGLEQTVCHDAEALKDFPALTKLHAKIREEKWLQDFLASDMRKTKDQSSVPGYVETVKGIFH